MPLEIYVFKSSIFGKYPTSNIRRPDLPFVTLSILNLRIPRGGGDQIINLLTLVGPHIMQAYQFTKISLIEGLENYF